MITGAGLVKITPAHDKLDFVIGTDNNLPFVKIFRSNGTLNQNCGEFQVRTRTESSHFFLFDNFWIRLIPILGPTSLLG